MIAGSTGELTSRSLPGYIELATRALFMGMTSRRTFCDGGSVFFGYMAHSPAAGSGASIGASEVLLDLSLPM